MYRRVSSSWVKHLDFLILDLLAIEAAYMLSRCVQGTDFLSGDQYLTDVGLIAVIHIVTLFFCNYYQGILWRDFTQEVKVVCQQSLTNYICLVGMFFLTRDLTNRGRTEIVLYAVLLFSFLFLIHFFWKKYVLKRKLPASRMRSMLLVSTRARCEKTILHMRTYAVQNVKITGVVLVDQNHSEKQKILDVPIVAGKEGAVKYIRQNWVDEVFIDSACNREICENILSYCDEMGVTVHEQIAGADDEVQPKFVEKINGYTVLTSSMQYASPVQMLVKRLMDIAGGLVGCLFTAVLFLFVAPMIYCQSPGPIFFSQNRVGLNGKLFKIYKFRSMYLDAEERKAELMKKNKMKGHMFKLVADPRIIGSGPDGTKHGVGYWIRKLSIDEFPQFWNVLKGDMSLVGTRPPTVDEWAKYDLHHRARMAVKPGLTGMWQASGRSNITDFEEVVRLDIQYIREWRLLLDVKILLKTVWVLVRGIGAE